jgi:hypothetical protein
MRGDQRRQRKSDGRSRGYEVHQRRQGIAPTEAEDKPAPLGVTNAGKGVLAYV